MKAHAKRSGEIAQNIAQAAGYGGQATERLCHIISEGEFHNDDPDVQVLRDANSISIFDNNISYYLKTKGLVWTKTKMQANYERSSKLAQKHIRDLLRAKPNHNLFNL